MRYRSPRSSSQKAPSKPAQTQTSVRVVKLVIAFQGTAYGGWQSQLTGKTLQEIVMAALARALNEKVHVQGSSRTDSGVHAQAFVAHFKTKSLMTDEKILRATNYFLPGDIVIRSALSTKASFHAQYSAKGKTYQYVIWNSRVRPPYDVAPYALWKPVPMDVARMKLAAKYLVGKHDFSAFRDSGEEEKDPVRKVKSLKIVKTGSKITITVVGDGFLRHMIRVIAGTLIEVGRGKLAPTDVKRILLSKDRKQAGPTIKAQGLTLLKVHY